MPLCNYHDAFLKNDQTIVENIFLREFLPGAPDGYVKIYLYGLMQCQSGVGPASLSGFARDVLCSETDVQQAFAYWQEKGLVMVKTSPLFSVFYLDVHNALPEDASVFTQAVYNQQIQGWFAPKLVNPAELSRVYDWTDVFGIDQQAVPLLIAYGQQKLGDLSKASARRQISYIDKIARQWSELGIHTAEEAELWMAEQQDQQSGLAAVLQRLGLRRNPTLPERNLYQSWLQKGFDQPSILAAADRTVSVRNPSLDTLDSILTDLDRQGKHTAEQIQSDQSAALCKEVLQVLGVSAAVPTVTQLNQYVKWLEEGHSHERILLAAEMCKARNTLRFSDIAATLTRWQSNALRGVKSIRQYEKARTEVLDLLSHCFERMGISHRIEEADITLAYQWMKTWKLPEELVLFAAECSHGAKSPYRMQKRLLEQWYAAKITTVSAARQAFSQQATGDGKPGNRALEFDQRPLEEQQDLSHLLHY